MAVLLVAMVCVVLIVWGTVLLSYRITLVRLWREAAMRQPVLIIESDDWGPGPDTHVAALNSVCEVLKRHRDGSGRPAVMTVGVVLAVPDNVAIRDDGYREYARVTLRNQAYRSMRDALLQGQEGGVLALQLHGLEHLWPPSFLHAARHDDAVRRWVDEGSGIDTESLPSPAQSRWTDTRSLPSRPIEPELVHAAVAEELQVFAECFGQRPAVAVPPTFVWNGDVERAWTAGGIQTIVTPGKRYTGRDAAGRPAFADRSMLNGERAEGGGTYLVRDVYFEPSLGHDAAVVFKEVTKRLRLGRPALLETHRFNFTGEPSTVASSLEQIDRLLTIAVEQVPRLRFMSAAELGDVLRRRDEDWVDRNLSGRLVFWLRRLAANGRLRKIAWLTGLALPAGLLYLAAGGRTRACQSFQP